MTIAVFNGNSFSLKLIDFPPDISSNPSGFSFKLILEINLNSDSTTAFGLVESCLQEVKTNKKTEKISDIFIGAIYKFGQNRKKVYICSPIKRPRGATE